MSIYYTDLVTVLTAAGVTCRVEDVNAGWETRARGSGGFSAAPLGIIDHHTASDTTPLNDLNYMIHNADDSPIGNLYLDRDGHAWPIAAGASNCAGKGGPYTFSRGTVPVDSGNSRCWNIEAANSGVGEPWPEAQVSSYIKINIALSARFGNLPTDVASHQEWAPSRKVDPATAAAVQGPWKPRSINSSGTWNMDDMRAECSSRAGTTPTPPPSGDDDMTPQQAEQLDAVYKALLVQNPWNAEQGMSMSAESNIMHTISRVFWDNWPNTMLDGPGTMARTIKRIAQHFNLKTD